MNVGAAARHAWRDPVIRLVGAGALVGVAVQLRLGRFDGLALALVLVGLAVLVSVVGRPSASPAAISSLRRSVVAGLVVVHAVAMIPLAIEVFEESPAWSPVVAAVAGCLTVVFALDQVRGRPRVTGGGHLLAVAVAILGVCWVVSEGTTIDVFQYQTTGAERLLAGESPWAPGYPNPYDAEASADFFGPGLADADTVDFGFPYPPLSLLLSTLGYLAGDLRLAHLTAVVVAGWLLLHAAGPAWTARAGGVLLLTSPMLLPTVQRGWTETFLVLGLVGVVLVLRSARRDGSAWLALGVLLALKQYAAMLLPILLVVGPRWQHARERWRAAVASVATAIVVTLPLSLWGFRDFLHSVVTLQLHQPFREDAMSIPALLERAVGWPGETLAAIAMVPVLVAALGFVLLRAPRSWSGVAGGSALVLLAFLLVNKQAFTNYYMFAVSAIWLAVAVHDEPATVPGRGLGSSEGTGDRRSTAGRRRP